MVKAETLQRRVGELESAIAADKQPSPCTERATGWMAKQPETRIATTATAYERAEEQMAGNYRPKTSKPPSLQTKQDPKKIVVSTSDPDAVSLRLATNIMWFRPLYRRATASRCRLAVHHGVSGL